MRNTGKQRLAILEGALNTFLTPTRARPVIRAVRVPPAPTVAIGTPLPVPPKPVRKPRVKKAAPMVSPPTGLRDPGKLLGQRLGLTPVYCGPWVLMAVTGRPYEEVCAALNARRSGRKLTDRVTGTVDYHINGVLGRYGWATRMVRNQPGKSLAAVLRERTAEERREVWLVSAGHHWALVQGRKVTCCQLRGWSTISHAKYRRAKVRAVYRLTQATDGKARAAEAKAYYSQLLKDHQRLAKKAA